MAFALNQGQTTDQSVKLISQGQNYTIFFTNNQTVLTLDHPTTTTTPPHPRPQPATSDVFALSFVGANANAKVVPGELLTQRTNYFLGARSFTDVPNYGRVRIDNLYQGISVEYYGNTAGKLEHDFIVSPGADPSRIRMQYQGVQSATQDSAGNQILQTAGGRLTLQAPQLYQLDAHGLHQAVTGGFQTFADHSVGFSVGAFDRSRALVIDPILGYSTVIGGGGDTSSAITADLAGNTYITGNTPSPNNFPTFPLPPSFTGSQAAFVNKFSSSGALIYSTMFGGTDRSDGQSGYGIAVDPTGDVVVAGQLIHVPTGPSTFPVTSGAYQTSLAQTGDLNGFVTKFAGSGDAMIYSTFLNYAQPYAVAVNPTTGEAFIAGSAKSGFSATDNAYQHNFGGGVTDAFFVKLNSTGTAASYATFLGGTDDDVANGIAIDEDGNAYICGSSTSNTLSPPPLHAYPTTLGAYQHDFGTNATTDAFVTKLNLSALDPLASVVYSTFVGGSGADVAYAIALDDSRQAYITGSSADATFPTTSMAYRSTNPYPNHTDVFVTALDAAGAHLVYSTLVSDDTLPGDDDDAGRGIALVPGGEAIVTGQTRSSNFPTSNSIAGSQFSSPESAFVTRLDSTGHSLIYSSFLARGQGYGVATDPLANVYLTGAANGGLVTTLGTFQTVSGAYVVKLTPDVAAPIITAVVPDTGYSQSDHITNSQNLVISGTAQPNRNVTLFVDGTPSAET
jgi:hypothetical protein